MPDRPAIHAYLSPEAHDAWIVFAEENGVSVTGLLEAFGQNLLLEMRKDGADEIRQDWVKDGRRVDAARRRRGGDR